VVSKGVARVIGLTGGIACGKSTVADMLRELGAPVVDADELARRVVERNAPALAEIVARFGQGVLDPSGALDRKKLGAIVFADPGAREALERITHPRIAAAAQAELARLAAEGHHTVIYEAALIVEKKLHTWMDGLIVVSLPAELQLARLMARDGIDREAAASRIAAQLPLADKIAVADHVIDNAGTMDHTRAQVRAMWQRISGS
jgi:dephospho-CoA kinase